MGGGTDGVALQKKAKHIAAAFEQYLERDWAGALEAFEALARLHTDDRPSELLIERCRSYPENPPGADRSGIWRLQEK